MAQDELGAAEPIRGAIRTIINPFQKAVKAIDLPKKQDNAAGVQAANETFRKADAARRAAEAKKPPAKRAPRKRTD